MAKEKKVKESNNKGKDKKAASFFKEFKAELKRVSWPTFKQLVNNTAIVILLVVVVAAIVFVLDVVFESLTTYGVDRLKALVPSSLSESVEDHNHEGESEESHNEEGNAESSEANPTGEMISSPEMQNTVENKTVETDEKTTESNEVN